MSKHYVILNQYGVDQNFSVSGNEHDAIEEAEETIKKGYTETMYVYKRVATIQREEIRISTTEE
jgi:hypothetical protein